jgi:hypothetical protein
VKQSRKSLLASVLILACAAGAGAQDIAVAPPARNWILPLFTKEGFRQMTLRGDEVHPITSDRVYIIGMNFTVFTSKADSKVDTVLLSPEGTFMISERIAHGDKSVRLIRDDAEATGDGWVYYYNEKKVLILKNAHVVFQAALPDILK